MAIKRELARKAVKTTAKHTAHGTVSKLRSRAGGQPQVEAAAPS